MPTKKQKTIQKKRTAARTKALYEAFDDLKTPDEVKQAIKQLRVKHRELAQASYNNLKERGVTFPDKRGLPVVAIVVHARGDKYACTQTYESASSYLKSRLHDIEMSNAGNPQCRIAVRDVATAEQYGVDLSTIMHAQLGDYEDE